VKSVRISLSVACVCFAIAAGDAFLASERITPAIEAYRSMLEWVSLLALLIAFGAIAAAAIFGISTVVRHRQDLGFHDYSLIAGASILGVLVLLFVIDVATGSFALSGWQVPVTARVVDASTGTPVQDARVSYAFSSGDESDYQPVDAVVAGPITRFEIHMTVCRAEGGILSRFRSPARPLPSMYRFEFAAAGFLPQRVDGTVGELVEDPLEPSRHRRFVLRLPEVKLELLPR
jgi:hypothetical protein